MRSVCNKKIYYDTKNKIKKLKLIQTFVIVDDFGS